MKGSTIQGLQNTGGPQSSLHHFYCLHYVFRAEAAGVNTGAASARDKCTTQVQPCHPSTTYTSGVGTTWSMLLALVLVVLNQRLARHE